MVLFAIIYSRHTIGLRIPKVSEARYRLNYHMCNGKLSGELKKHKVCELYYELNEIECKILGLRLCKRWEKCIIDYE